MGAWLAAGIVALIALAAIPVGLVWYRRRQEVLTEVIRVLSALEDGRPTRPVQRRLGGSVGQLARVMNRVAGRLEERIGRLEGDRQLLRTVLGGMTEGVIAIDARRRLLFANDAADRLFGLGAGAVGRHLGELIRGPKILDVARATLEGPDPQVAEIAHYSTVGATRGQLLTLEVQGTPLPGSPPSGAVLVVQDVTETRRLERVRQDFVANASHELKTPLAAIKAYTETLLDGAIGDEAVNIQFLRKIDEQADRLGQLVLDLLTLARLEGGQDSFQHAPLRLASVVRQVAETQRPRAAAGELELSAEIAPEAEEVVVTADEEAIRQILDNLIDNAIKYTPPGGKVLVRLASVDNGDVQFEVSDTGIGIPRDELPRVFERFYRVDKARSRALGGTGLGLSIVRHMVQSLGGEVRVESRVGVGSTFLVRLPRAAAGQST